MYCVGSFMRALRFFINNFIVIRSTNFYDISSGYSSVLSSRRNGMWDPSSQLVLLVAYISLLLVLILEDELQWMRIDPTIITLARFGEKEILDCGLLLICLHQEHLIFLIHDDLCCLEYFLVVYFLSVLLVLLVLSDGAVDEEVAAASGAFEGLILLVRCQKA